MAGKNYVREKLTNPVFLFNAGVLAVFVVLNLVAGTYAEDARRFPRFVLLIGTGVILFWMVVYFLFPRAMQFIEAQEEHDDEATAEGKDGRRFLLAWCCVAVSLLVGSLFGFLFIVPAAFLSYGLLLGDREKWVSLVVIAAITTVVFYVAFDYILTIPLLKGVFVDRF